MSTQQFVEYLDKEVRVNRPKRLLSLDGGGFRGIITTKVLMRMETILQEHNSDWKCLGDYFDFIGGTSTGALLAAGLAQGMKAQKLLDFYESKRHTIFAPRLIYKIPFLGKLWTKYPSKPLEKELKVLFGDRTLGDHQKAILMIVAKNVTTGGTRFFCSSEKNKYYKFNRHLPVWELVRASGAAPTYFPPHTFKKSSRRYEFIDGGLSSYNHPAFQLFNEATHPDYGICWKTGKENILLTSIGTGFIKDTIPMGHAKKYMSHHWAPYAIDTLMDAAKMDQENLLQQACGGPRGLFTYHRYGANFTVPQFQQWKIDKELCLNTSEDITKKINKLKPLDCIDQVEALKAIGDAVAREKVSIESFKGFLDD